MTERETVLLREFKDKLDKLIEVHFKVKNENILLKEKLSAMEEQLRVVILQNNEIIKKHENLKFAKSLVCSD
jgi:hypothetical protein